MRMTARCSERKAYAPAVPIPSLEEVLTGVGSHKIIANGAPAPQYSNRCNRNYPIHSDEVVFEEIKYP